MSIAEHIHHLLLKHSPDDPNWKPVYELATVLEEEDVPTVRTLKRRLGRLVELKSKKNGRE